MLAFIFLQELCDACCILLLRGEGRLMQFLLAGDYRLQLLALVQKVLNIRLEACKRSFLGLLFHHLSGYLDSKRAKNLWLELWLLSL